MEVTRRRLLRLGPASIAFTAMMPKWVIGADLASSDPLLTMSSKNFEPLVGTVFTANANTADPTWLTLHVVEGLPTHQIGIQSSASTMASPIPTEAFALHFAGAGAPLENGTYEFEHSKLGSISLFVVRGRLEYTAVINHLTGPLPPSYQIPVAAAKKA